MDALIRGNSCYSWANCLVPDPISNLSESSPRITRICTNGAECEMMPLAQPRSHQCWRTYWNHRLWLLERPAPCGGGCLFRLGHRAAPHAAECLESRRRAKLLQQG